MEDIWTSPPWALFNTLTVLDVSIYIIVLAEPAVTKSPWTLLRTNSLVWPIETTDSFPSLPWVVNPRVLNPTTSPIWYPEPPALIVAPDETIFPLLIVISAVAPLPLPVRAI